MWRNKQIHIYCCQSFSENPRYQEDTSFKGPMVRPEVLKQGFRHESTGESSCETFNSSSRVTLLESSHAPRVESLSSSRALLLESSHSPRVEPFSSSRVILLESSRLPPLVELHSSIESSHASTSRLANPCVDLDSSSKDLHASRDLHDIPNPEGPTGRVLKDL